MADYHPLDVRYKGPSTAYRGSAAKKANTPMDDDLPAVKDSHVPAPPPLPGEQGPWGAMKAPARETPAMPAPPPLPAPRPKSSGRAGRRVFFGLAFLILIVVLNMYLSRGVGLMTLDVEDAINSLDGRMTSEIGETL